MRKININICTAILAAVMFFVCIVFVSAERGAWTDEGKFDGAWLGDYESTEEYFISESSQLAAFAAAAEAGYTFEGKVVVLLENIDMSDNYWNGVFTSETAFCGKFDGQGHIISGLEVPEGAECGAFILYNNGTIQNLSIKITSSAKSSAGIALYNYGSVYNSSVSGSIGSPEATLVGGIVGDNNFNIRNCINVSTLECSDAEDVFCGAITAKNQGFISECIWTGAEKEVGYGAEAELCKEYTDAQTAVDFLNQIALWFGYCEWMLDTIEAYDGFPIMKNAGPDISVNGISFDKRELDMRVGNQYKLSVSFYPYDATDKSLVWLSTNEAVATVDKNGNVTAHKAGYAIIRATSVDGEKEANCFVRVRWGNEPVLCESIKLNKNEYTIILGQSAQIIATVFPENAHYPKLIYTVDDESVVTCDKNGMLTPVSPGISLVTVKSEDGNCTTATVVTVIEETYSYTWDGTYDSSFGGGEGTKENPYIIETPGQLAKLARDVNSGNSYEGCYFVQKISIRLNDTTFEDWRDRLSYKNAWTPIGKDSNNAFRGNYDGAGFSVSGINIEKDSGVGGLFGYTEGGIIENVNIKHSYIKAGDFVGSVVGYNSSLILKCTSNAHITGNKYTGGIAGYTLGKIEYCKSRGTVSGTELVGGIAGQADSHILNCANYAQVTGDESIGGICGKNTAVIENCCNEAYVSGKRNCGGITGYADMDAVNCHSFVMPVCADGAGTIAGFSRNPVSSYTPNTLAAVGNLPNFEDYLLVPEIDGSFTLKKNKKPYVEVLNLFGGCIYSNTYLEWTVTDGVVSHSVLEKVLTSTTDKDTGIELSGPEIIGGGSYTFENIEGEQLLAALSKINGSSMFEKDKLDGESIIFSKNIHLSEQGIQNTHYKLTLPVDITMIKDYDKLGEFQVFAHVAFISLTEDEMRIYIPEYVKKGADGTYSGNMRCISHGVAGTEISNESDMAHKFSFYYKDARFSFAAEHTGEWLVAELGENENIIPIETDSSKVTVPTDTDGEKKALRFNTTLTVIVCIVLFVAGAAVILIQRSKNNLTALLHRSKSDGTEDN